MNIDALVDQMIILFTIIFLGWACVKLGLLPKNANNVLSALVVNVTNPCSVLASVMGGQRVLTTGEVGLLVAVAVGMHLLLLVVGRIVPRLLRVPDAQLGLYRFMFTFGNMGFLGFPVIKALYGQQALLLAAIFVLVFQLFSFTYGVSQFGKGHFRWKKLVNPMIISTVFAFTLYLLNLQPPAIVYRVFDTVGTVTSPAAMLCIGCALAGVKLGSVFTNWRLYVSSLLKLTVMPVVMFGLCSGWMPNEMMLGVAVTCSAMPTATNTTLLANLHGGDEGLAASGVFLSTLMSLVTLPLMLWLLF